MSPAGPGWWASGDLPRARARSWTVRGAVNGALAVLVAVGAAVCALGCAGRSGEPTPTEWGQMVPPDLPAGVAGCGPRQQVDDPSSIIGVVDVTGALPYDTTPPAAGWFWSTRAEAGDIDAPPEQVLASMWTGRRAIWLASDASKVAIQRALDKVAAHPEWNAAVYRWPSTRPEQLPSGTVSMAAWGVVQTCEEFDVDVVGAFFASAPRAPGTPSDVPPVAFERP